MLIQEQLSLVSDYARQIAKQMEVLGDAYTKSPSFVSQLCTLKELCDVMNGEIIREVKLLTSK